MERKIESIKIQKSKYSTTIYVNFDNSTFATHTKENGKWFDSGFRADELNQAKSLALHDGTWHNYRVPRAETLTESKFFHKDEEQLDAESERDFHQTTTFASQSDKEY